MRAFTIQICAKEILVLIRNTYLFNAKILYSKFRIRSFTYIGIYCN